MYVCILDRKIFLYTLFWVILSILVIPPNCHRVRQSSCVAKFFFKQKWSQAVILFSVFNPAVRVSVFNPAPLLMSSFQGSCCSEYTCCRGHFPSQGKASFTLTVKTERASEADRPELDPGSLRLSRLLKLNETHFSHLQNEDSGTYLLCELNEQTPSIKYVTGFLVHTKYSTDTFSLPHSPLLSKVCFPLLLILESTDLA